MYTFIQFFSDQRVLKSLKLSDTAHLPITPLPYFIYFLKLFKAYKNNFSMCADLNGRKAPTNTLLLAERTRIYFNLILLKLLTFYYFIN